MIGLSLFVKAQKWGKMDIQKYKTAIVRYFIKIRKWKNGMQLSRS